MKQKYKRIVKIMKRRSKQGSLQHQLLSAGSIEHVSDDGDQQKWGNLVDGAYFRHSFFEVHGSGKRMTLVVSKNGS